MTPDEQQVFVNALREALGLGPLYGKTLEVESDPWWAPYMGTGNRQVRSARKIS
jgi:hypothetical protein